jgi:hypothetical protein
VRSSSSRARQQRHRRARPPGSARAQLARNARAIVAVVDVALLAWTLPASALGDNLHYYQADRSKPDAICAT